MMMKMMIIIVVDGGVDFDINNIVDLCFIELAIKNKNPQIEIEINSPRRCLNYRLLWTIFYIYKKCKLDLVCYCFTT